MVSELEKKLDEIKEIKAEWGIGSQEAFRYMGSVETMSQLTDKVRARLHGRTKALPSYREVSNLCDGFYNYLSWLNFAGTKFEYGGGVEIKYPCIERSKEYANMFGFFKRFDPDYESALCKYYNLLEIAGSSDEAFREAFAVFFDDAQTKEPHFRIDNLARRFKKLIASSENEEDRERNMFEGSEFISFMLWMDGEVGHEPRTASDLKLNRLTWEEKRYLLGEEGGKNLYERAVRDQSLGNLWVERKIALSEVIKMEHESENTEEKIESSVDYFKKLVRRRDILLMTLKKRLPIGVPLDFQLETLHKAQYSLKVVSLHRKWLKKVLDR